MIPFTNYSHLEQKELNFHKGTITQVLSINSSGVRGASAPELSKCFSTCLSTSVLEFLMKLSWGVKFSDSGNNVLRENLTFHSAFLSV